MSQKVNIENFSLNNMLAKLLVITRNYGNKRDELLADRSQFDAFVTEQAQASFEYPASHERGIVSHLSLFLLGNPDNKFSALTK